MYKNFKFIKNKVLMPFVIALFAAYSFAEDKNLNYYGQLGVHKTQSAQTLGHGGFGIGLFGEGVGMSSIVQGEEIRYYGNPVDLQPTERVGLEQYFGMNLFPFLSVGISPYFDIGVSLPAYVDVMESKFVQNGACHFGPCREWKVTGGQGDLRLMAKLRAPFPDDILIDLAFIGGMTINIGRTDKDAYGLWVRDMSYINTNEDDSRLIWSGDQASAYTNGLNMLSLGLAATFDFNKIRAQFPLRWHLNYNYRMALGEKVNDKDIKAVYPQVQTFSTAMEWTPIHFVSLFGEYYRDMPNKSPTMAEGDFGLSTVTLGTSLHFTESFDLQIGVQMLVPGSQDKYYIQDLNHEFGKYNAALMPKILPFIGLNVKLFNKEPEEEEYRNPDTDDDGFCDPWVAETGRQREFAKICTGIDLCPYEPGENNGCPAKKEAFRNPDTDGDGVCDPWVSEEGREEEFSNCTGIDLCPYEAGTKENSGCPVVETKSAEPTIMFSASPNSVQAGKSVTLSWITTDADEVEIDNGVGKVQARGTKKVSPSATTTYIITVKGKGGTKTETAEVVIEAAAAPTAVFSAAPEVIQKGQSVTLTWMTTNATEVSIEGVGVVPLKGTRKLTPTATTTYTMIAKGEGGQVIEAVEVMVEEPKIEAKVNLKGVNFLSGKAELTLDARRVLDGVVEQLMAVPNVKIEIHGHTDNVGKQATNQDLSERRAKAVVGYLASKGVKSSRMKAVGFGQDSPIADNSTASGRELNRRIEMIRVDD